MEGEGQEVPFLYVILVSWLVSRRGPGCRRDLEQRGGGLCLVQEIGGVPRHDDAGVGRCSDQGLCSCQDRARGCRGASPWPHLEDPSLTGKSADHQKQEEGHEGDDDAEGAEEEEPVEDGTVEADTLVDAPEPEDSDNGNPKPAKVAKKADAIAAEEAASPVVPPGQPQPPLLATPADKTVEEVCV